MSVGALALAIVVGGWFVARNAGAGPALDRNVYVVFPFRDDSATRRTGLDGEEAASRLNRAMRSWRGIQVVDVLRVSDLWARNRPGTVDDGLRAAEALSAGELAWGQMRIVGDSLEMHVVAYDVSAGRGASRDFQRSLPVADRDEHMMDSVFAALADSVINGGQPPTGIDVYGTHDLQARDEFRYGSEALQRFDFSAAQSHFDAATLADENFALAHFWAARIRAWRGITPPSAWLPDISQAVRLRDSLTVTDREHALALLNLAKGRAPDACRLYRGLLVTDPNDFAAWLGLGDCNALDDGVVRDSRSRTGYAFRGSYWMAVTAYRRALEIMPSLHQAERGAAFQRLAGRVLYTEESRLRRGVGVSPDTQRYVAFPSFAGDSLGFVPMPYRLATAANLRPATEYHAVLWAATTMRELTREWIDAFPTSADAQAAYSLALETAGAIEGSTTELPQALSRMRRAAAQTDSADQRVYRDVAVVRLLLKLDSLPSARRLSDSLLSSVPSPTPHQAGYLANLAALTGRARRAAALLRVAAADSEHVPFLGFDGRRLVLPGDLMPSILALRVYAALGEPRDSVRATYQQVERMLRRSVPAATRLAMRSKVLWTPAVLAEDDFAATELADMPDADPLLEMRAAVSRHDARAARAAGDRFSAQAEAFTPGATGIDRRWAYATMLLAIGDSAAAIRELDVALDALPRARSILLEVTPQAAAVGRTLLLRTQLALRERDRATARRRFTQLELLWSAADTELKSAVDALRRQL